MTVARAYSAAVVGLDGRLVVVETAVGAGLPGLTIVGLPDAAVKESRERIRAALRHVGFPLPGKNVIVNLAPADLPKAGSGLDLPAALSILAANGDLPSESLEGVMSIGELALDGTVRAVPGVLSFAELARKEGRTEVLVPVENAAEANAVGGLVVRATSHVGAAIAHLAGRERIPPFETPDDPEPRGDVALEHDLKDVRGQLLPRRALEIAAAGGHNLLLTGPPGAGKTMLARGLPGLLPPPSREEAIEITRIWSVAGRLAGAGLLQSRPFRSPHHGASAAALTGGGSEPRPGEFSLAHRGVLFLDELPEYRRDVLESLREPLEEGVVTVARAAGARVFPARFLLVAARNPCPCGHRGDARRLCGCSDAEVSRYARRVSGPLLDRIDLHVEVAAVQGAELRDDSDAEPSSAVRARVARARDRQRARSEDGLCLNAALPTRQLKRHARADAPARELLEKAVDRLALSARSALKVLRVALTVADLEGADNVGARHVSEALRYRSAPAG